MNQIFEFELRKNTVEKLEDLFDTCLKDSSLLIPNEITCTVKGTQTKSVINFVEQSCLDNLFECIKGYIEQYYDNNLISYQFFVDHVHLIKYDKGGYQLGHTHHNFEDHSFIVYLNDSNAVTRIYFNGTYKEIKSVKGNCVVFDSSLFHESTPCNDTRNVLVGSIKFSHKNWKIATN